MRNLDESPGERHPSIEISRETGRVLRALRLPSVGHCLRCFATARCVSDIARTLKFDIADMSKHLSELESLGLVRTVERIEHNMKFRYKELTESIQIDINDHLLRFDITTGKGARISISHPLSGRDQVQYNAQPAPRNQRI